MKIKTEILQKMVAKAIQGASNNKMIPITGLIGVEVKNEKLTLMTTDGSNQLRVMEKVELDPIYGPTDSQEFYTIVNAETFSKLVGKITKEFIEFENKENYLEIKGNGVYKLEIAINEEGEMVRFPEILDIKAEPYSVSTLLLQEAIKAAKASVAKTMEIPCLTGYYISDKTISTDRQLIFQSSVGLSKEPLLLSSEMAELLLLVEDETTNILHKDNELIFFNENFKISGKELEGKETYPVQQIEGLLQTSYNNTIKVNKQELLNVLDRMSLFVSDYDKGGVFLDFEIRGLTLKSQKSNAVEVIQTPETNDRATFNCLVDIEMLKSQIETISTDVVEIQYGQEKSIKILDENCIHIISLLDKEN